MVFRFLILSDEVDDFKREIKIDSEATFLDLYNAIMDYLKYKKVVSPKLEGRVVAK